MRSFLVFTCLFVGVFTLDAPEATNATAEAVQPDAESAPTDINEEIRSLGRFFSQMHGLVLDLHGRHTRSLDDDEAAKQSAEESQQLRGLGRFVSQMHGILLDLHGRHTRSLGEEEQQLSDLLVKLQSATSQLDGRQTRALGDDETAKESDDDAIKSIGEHSEQISELLSKVDNA